MNTVEEIRALQKELREAMQTRETSAQAAIRGLTAEVSAAQAALDTLPASQDAAKAQKAILDGEKEARQETLEALNRDIAEAQQSVECMEAEAADVEEKAKGVEHASSEQAPRVLHALSLYANITGIRWKYEDDENSHLIRGCTCLCRFVSALLSSPHLTFLLPTQQSSPCPTRTRSGSSRGTAPRRATTRLPTPSGT